jgi:membrane dipeptidase
MEEAGELVQIVDVAGLQRQLAIWQADPPADAPIGYILSLEGADSIRTPRHLEQAYAQGLRALGPAHYGPGRYAQGTHATGGLTAAGIELLKEMDRLGMILDATHLCDDSFWQAMDLYQGPVWASHSNCRELVPNDRQFSDEQLKVLIERGAVIGGVLDAWMMIAGWKLFKTLPEEMGLKLERLLDHMDHICQLAGSARHIGIGSDLDGGFGREQCPMDLDTIADLSRLPDMLAARGYAAADIELIAHGNWVRFLGDAWKK